jgi:hypothetical protein
VVRRLQQIDAKRRIWRFMGATSSIGQLSLPAKNGSLWETAGEVGSVARLVARSGQPAVGPPQKQLFAASKSRITS